MKLPKLRKKRRRKPRVTNVSAAGPDHQVVSVVGGTGYRKTPCDQCPFRVDQTGKFPAEAFRHSADTAYDAATKQFGCHMSGSDKPATCAGFLLRNAHNNLGARMARIDRSQLSDGGLELHGSYRAMAIANGVDLADPVLARCRANDQF